MAKTQEHETDLGSVFNSVRRNYDSFSMIFYRGLNFLFRNWIIILGLLIGGAFLGYLLKRNSEPPKESTLIVQINFGSAQYVYEAVELLNNKLAENDTVFLKNAGFRPKVIAEIEIEPIVNLFDILNNPLSELPNVETLVEQAQYEDNLLTSEIFIPEYRAHKISITTNSLGNSSTLTAVLAYLNDNELFKKIREIQIAGTNLTISENTESINYIDSIFNRYGASTGDGSQISYNSTENSNLHLLFREKNNMLEENNRLRIELLKYDNTVELINKPALSSKHSFFSRTMLLLPLLFVFVFLAGAFFIKLYRKALRVERKRKENMQEQ